MTQYPNDQILHPLGRAQGEGGAEAADDVGETELDEHVQQKQIRRALTGRVATTAAAATVVVVEMSAVNQ